MLIDTHAHLYAKEFDTDRQGMIDRAIKGGVERIYLPNIDLNSIKILKETLSISPLLYPMMGLHPCSVKEDYIAVLQDIKSELDSSIYYAIGEMGIDLYWDKTTKDIQVDAFKIQCQWAIEKNLPIIIHSREATQDVLNILEEMNPRPIKGIFHCFSGTLEEIQRIDALGEYYYGIGGVITYKNGGLAEIVSKIPQHKLVLETDSPYLAPAPYRGKRNESSFIIHIAKKLSESLGISLEEIGKITTENAIKLFK
ncbi:MAG: TatD family hydrolase [Saprospiraceae bacterium]